MNLKKRSFCTGDILYAALLSVLLFAKCMLFYSGIRIGGFELPLSLATCALLLLIWAIVGIRFPKGAKITLTVLYVFASAVMAVDSVYFAYVSKLPSVAQLNMIGQLDDVSTTILDLIQLKHLALIADLQLWVFYAANRDLLAAKLSRTRFGTAILSRLHSSLPIKAVLPAAVLLSVLFAAAVFLYPQFEPEYITNELFCYHAIDVAKAVQSGTSERVVDKSLYTAPDESASEYFGLAKDRNVFIIQVEAMQNFVLGASYDGQELTPTLNAMIGGDTFYFNNYYYQIGGGNTADAEFAVNNSLFAPEAEAAYVKYPNNSYFGLPQLLKANGYSGAHAFHNYVGTFWNRESAYPMQGFDDFTSLEDLEETDMFEMGLSDRELFRQSMEQIKTYAEPFYCFYVTVSSHYPFAIPPKDRAIELREEDVGTLCGLYCQAMNYVDRAIGAFVEELKEAGLYDNSVLVIYGDHYAITNTDEMHQKQVSELLGHPYTIYDVFNVPLIIHVPGMNRTETRAIAGGHMDVLPTLLCLLGIRNDRAVMFGQNLLTAEYGLVCEQTHLGIGSFISDEVFFSKPHNNIRSNYDAYDRETMAQLDPDSFRETSDLCTERIEDCAALLAEDDILLN